MVAVRHVTSAIGLVLAFGAWPAAACSVVDSYRVPTNLELTSEADLILLARVAEGVGEPADVEDWSITIHPIAAIKGDLPDGDIALPGLMLASERFAVLSNPYEFEAAHPLSYIGGCIRYIFPLGTTALFFLERRNGEWTAGGGAFTRWAEDVPDADAPWVVLTRLYARAGQLPETEARALLESERDRLRARTEDPVAQLMAADIARQLAGPTETWNRMTERQLGLFENVEAETEDALNSVDAALAAMRGKAREDADEAQADSMVVDPAETD